MVLRQLQTTDVIRSFVLTHCYIFCITYIVQLTDYADPIDAKRDMEKYKVAIPVADLCIIVCLLCSSIVVKKWWSVS